MIKDRQKERERKEKERRRVREMKKNVRYINERMGRVRMPNSKK